MRLRRVLLLTQRLKAVAVVVARALPLLVWPDRSGRQRAAEGRDCGRITLDRQSATGTCPEHGPYAVVRGSCYENGRPFGLYLIALHGHDPVGRLAHLAVALLDGDGAGPRPQAAAVVIASRPDRFECNFAPWAESPWSGETYLGEMLEPDDARRSRHRARFFDVTDRVVEDLPEVRDYFAA
jgi:hypothetical protein